LIFFLAAVLTPPDIISQVMLGVPLYLLFEGALLLARLLKKDAKKDGILRAQRKYNEGDQL
jgi:sec-independent protein translocase protein TatC